MKVAEIWRYPVKTMAGEKLQRVCIGPLGLETESTPRDVPLHPGAARWFREHGYAV